MSYKIPLFKLNFDHKESEAVSNTIASQWISMGPKTVEFENLFSEMFGARHSVALSNCTVSLHLALKCLDIQPEDEVICPSLTFVATVNAIKYVNAKPVFADIESVDYPVITADTIASKITPKTKAIIVMHYGGFSCNMNDVMALAKKHGLKVIEDACHAPLSEFEDRKLGTIGDVGCFSFFSNKNISTGEGGMLITNDPIIAERAKLMRSHGMTTMSYERSKGHSTTYDVVEAGYNYRIDDVRSSMGIEQLKKLQADLEKRAIVRKEYLDLLQGMDNLTIPFEDKTNFSSNYIFPVCVKDSEKRDSLRKFLAEKGIQTSLHYPPVHLFSTYFDEQEKLPITEEYANSTFTLPMYSQLTMEEVNYIVDQIKMFFDESIYSN